MKVHRSYWAASAVTLGLLATASAQAQLVMLCSTDANWCESKVREFTQETGVSVSMARKATGEVFAQLKAEAGNPKTDIWYGGTHDPHLQAANEGLLQPYQASVTALAEQYPWAIDLLNKSQSQVMGIYRITLGLGVNTQLLTKKNLPMPKCWRDLAHSAYRGEIEMANPTSSGTGYTVLATLTQLMGENTAFDYLKALHRNINRYTTSGTAQRQSVARGESMIGITFLDEFIPEQNLGAPIETVLPCEGTGYSVGAMSIVKGAKNLANARRFYEWALGAEVQTLRGEAQVIAIPSNRRAQVPDKVKALENANLINYDFVRYGSSAERKHLLERWNSEVNSVTK